MPKVGDRIMLVPESWPAPGYDAGYMGDVSIDGRVIGPEDTHLVEKVLPPRWFTHREMEITEVREVFGNVVYIVRQTVRIELSLKLLEREFEVIDDGESK